MLHDEVERNAKHLFFPSSFPYQNGLVFGEHDNGGAGSPPFGVTIDFDTLKEDTVTVLERDAMEQVRMPISKLETYIAGKVRF